MRWLHEPITRADMFAHVPDLHPDPELHYRHLPQPQPIGPATTPGPDAVLPERHPLAIAPGQLIPAHYHGCFGCGPTHPTGLHIQVTAGPGLDLVGQLTLTRDHQGAAGLGHGGLLAAVVDEAMGALHWMLRVPAVTARLEVDYLRPVPIGSVISLRARITGVAGRKVYTAALCGLADGPVLRASGLFVQVPSSHFRGFDAAQDADLDSLELNP